MATCFVIQPFDSGTFDKRYDEVLEPAIKAAGLEPYRVDRDPSATVPIEQIETGIRNAVVCLAEISLDNPNVWFELGYALACGTRVVLVCSKDRKVFPFDVHHRNIVRYSTESTSDFEALQKSVTARLEAEVKKSAHISQLADSPVQETSGLAAHEIAALVTIMEAIESTPSAYSIKQDMERLGFRAIATAVAIKRLEQLQFVHLVSDMDFNGNEYRGYAVTDSGTSWLLKNQHLLVLRRDEKPKRLQHSPKAGDYDDFPTLEEDDDLPF